MTQLFPSSARRHAARMPMARQVDDVHAMRPGERGQDRCEHPAVERESVQQNERWPRADGFHVLEPGTPTTVGSWWRRLTT